MPGDDWINEWVREPPAPLFRTMMTVTLVGLRSVVESVEASDSDEVFVLAGSVWNPAIGGYGLHGLQPVARWDEVDAGDHVALNQLVYQGPPQDIILVAYVGEDDAGETVGSGDERGGRRKSWGFTEPHAGAFWATLSSAVLRYQTTLDTWSTVKYVRHQFATSIFPNDDLVAVIVEPFTIAGLRSIADDDGVDFFADGALVPSGRWRRLMLAHSWGFEDGGYHLLFDVTFDRVLI
jgi:hypothetical protein